METWKQISERHKREKVDLLRSLSVRYSQAQAARILKTTSTQLNNFALRNGIKWETSGVESSLLKEDPAKIARLYKGGMLLAEIAKKYSGCARTVRSILVAEGVDIRPACKRSAAAPKTPKVETGPRQPFKPSLPSWAQHT